MSLRDLERASIREFVEAHADKLTGRVLDLGCGKQPYRGIVEAAGGDYHGWDRAKNPGSVVSEDVGDFDWREEKWDTILCTQIIQYAWYHDLRYWYYRDAGVDMGELNNFLMAIRDVLRKHETGERWLVMTGPTNWPVIEADDRVRFTANGIKHEFAEAYFYEWDVIERAHVEFDGERWPTGWGAVARA